MIMSPRNVLLTLVILAQLQVCFAGTEEEAVTQTVEGFYKVYIADVNVFMNAPAGKRPKQGKPAAFKWSRSFTKEFLRAYRKVSADPGLDYDPILQSNNVPDALKAKRVRVESAIAYADLEYVGYAPETPLLEVRLKKQNGKWLIDGLGSLNGKG